MAKQQKNEDSAIGINASYYIREWRQRYQALNRNGRPFLGKPTYIKFPVNPRGKGIRKLLRAPRNSDNEAKTVLVRHVYFSIFCLLLEDVALNNSKLQGYILGPSDGPATIEDIADIVYLEDNESIVSSAMDCLVYEMGWIEIVPWPPSEDSHIDDDECFAKEESERPHKSKSRKKNKSQADEPEEECESEPAPTSKPPLPALNRKKDTKTSPHYWWMVFTDGIYKIYGEETKITQSTLTTLRTHVFDKHWELCGPEKIKDRISKLLHIAHESKTAKNPLGWFVAEQSRIYLSNDNNNT